MFSDNKKKITVTNLSLSHFSSIAEAIVEASNMEPKNGYHFVGSLRNKEFISFRQLIDIALNRTKSLSQHGISPKDPVAIYVEDPKEFVITFMSLVLLGAIPVPLPIKGVLSDPSLYSERLSGSLKAILPKAVISHADHDLAENVARSILAKSIKAEKLTIPHIQHFYYHKPSLEDTVFIQLSSGTTSSPKPIYVSNRNLLSNVEAIMGKNGLDASRRKDLAISWLPLFHDMGLIGFIICPIVWCVSTVIIPTKSFVRNPKIWLDVIDEYRGTITYAPNFAFSLLSKVISAEKARSYNLSSLKTIGCGAEPINHLDIKRFEDLFCSHASLEKGTVKPSYGLAECTLAVSLTPIGDVYHTVKLDRKAFEKQAVAEDWIEGSAINFVSCGTVMPEYDVKIIDRHGHSLPDNQVGEIHVFGDSVANRNKAIFTTLFDGGQAKTYLNTQDLGFIRDGRLFVCGRSKDLIIVKGRNIAPQEIEWLVETIHLIRTGSVIAFADQYDSDRIHLMIGVKENIKSEDLERNVRNVVYQQLAIAIYEIHFVHPRDIPKTSSGKLRRSTAQSHVQAVLA